MSEITKAIKMLCDEKGLSYEAVLEAIQFALAAAYRKDFGNKQQNIKVLFDPESGDMKVWDVKTVVEDIDEEVLVEAQEELTIRREKARAEERELTEEDLADLPRFNAKTDIMLSEAKKIKKTAKIGDILEIKLEINDEFGRMAAQTAKQVIIQKVREAERNIMFDDFKAQEGEIIMGTVQRVEGRKVLIDFGKVTGILPSDKQIRKDIYRPGARMKFLLSSVEMSIRGPQIILSRNDNKFVEEVFKQEIPEIADGAIEIKGIARDAGFRSKVAVVSSDESIDPIGSCIGQRGGRINTIIEELSGEKVDVVLYNENAEEFITNSLSPAKVLEVKLDEENKEAIVFVAPDQFSLAIGRGGQNVRLAAELTGWMIKVKEQGGEEQETSSEVEVEDKKKKDSKEEEVEKEIKDEPEKVEKKEKKTKKVKEKKETKKKKSQEEEEVEKKDDNSEKDEENEEEKKEDQKDDK